MEITHTQATPIESENEIVTPFDRPKRELVQRCYRLLLGRPADVSGLMTYIGLLHKGGSAYDITVELLMSNESRQMQRTSGQLSAAVLEIALSETSLTDEWCGLITHLAAVGDEIAPALRDILARCPLMRRTTVGRVAVDMDGRPMGWAVNLATPNVPVDIRFATNDAAFSVRTSGGFAGLHFSAPDAFVRAAPETYVVTADNNPLPVETSLSLTRHFIARRLAGKRAWFYEVLSTAGTAHCLAATSPLDTHQRSDSPRLPDYLLHVVAQRYEGGYAELSQSQQDDLLEWYMIDFREQWNARAPFPVSDALCNYLQEPAFASGVSAVHTSRLLLMFWKRHFNEKRYLFDREANRLLVYKLVSSPNAGMASFLRACGNRLLGSLTQKHPASSRLPIGINWYWNIALTEEFRVESLEQVSPHEYLATTFQKLCYALATGNHLQLIPSEWLKYWLGISEGGLTRAEWQMAFLFLGLDTAEEQVRTWLIESFYPAHPELRLFASTHGVTINDKSVLAAALRLTVEGGPSDSRFYVVGHTSTTGLGANLWMSVDALQRAGIEPVVGSVDGREIQFQHSKNKNATELNRPVILFHVNADRVPQELARLPQQIQRGAYRIGFFLWETSSPPETHMLGVQLMDEIWVPTEYLAEIYRRHTQKPVYTVRKGMIVPPNIVRPGREALGLSQSDFVFLTIGDFHSSIPRKHPLAAVLAFKSAFPDRTDVKLVLKVRNIDYEHWSNRGGYWQRLEREINGDSRFVVFDSSLSDSEYWGLIDDCDAFVSLHRSEGFGYGLAHAMLRRRPVIASDYSGPRDFCNPDTAYVVPVTEIPVARHEMPAFDPRARWADPDVALASDALRLVAERSEESNRRVKNAFDLVSSVYSIEQLAKTYGERIAVAGIRTVEPKQSSDSATSRLGPALKTAVRSIARAARL
jgi:glycosyltransferase involved in cell wall biosynthesis